MLLSLLTQTSLPVTSQWSSTPCSPAGSCVDCLVHGNPWLLGRLYSWAVPPPPNTQTNTALLTLIVESCKSLLLRHPRPPVIHRALLAWWVVGRCLSLLRCVCVKTPLAAVSCPTILMLADNSASFLLLFSHFIRSVSCDGAGWCLRWSFCFVDF